MKNLTWSERNRLCTKSRYDKNLIGSFYTADGTPGLLFAPIIYVRTAQHSTAQHSISLKTIPTTIPHARYLFDNSAERRRKGAAWEQMEWIKSVRIGTSWSQPGRWKWNKIRENEFNGDGAHFDRFGAWNLIGTSSYIYIYIKQHSYCNEEMLRLKRGD